MSATTVNQAARDPELRGRIEASIAKETWANPTFGDTAWGAKVKDFGPSALTNYFVWPISIDNEAAYEYAINSGNLHPGLDPGVISDASLSTGIQTHWPDDSTIPTSP